MYTLLHLSNPLQSLLFSVKASYKLMGCKRDTFISHCMITHIKAKQSHVVLYKCTNSPIASTRTAIPINTHHLTQKQGFVNSTRVETLIKRRLAVKSTVRVLLATSIGAQTVGLDESELDIGRRGEVGCRWKGTRG